MGSFHSRALPEGAEAHGLALQGRHWALVSCDSNVQVELRTIALIQSPQQPVSSGIAVVPILQVRKPRRGEASHLPPVTQPEKEQS